MPRRAKAGTLEQKSSKAVKLEQKSSKAGTLVLSGRAKIEIGGQVIGEQIKDKSWYLHMWCGSSASASAPLKLSPSGEGWFEIEPMSVGVREGDPDFLKAMALTHYLDESSELKKFAPLASCAFDMNALMSGKATQATLRDSSFPNTKVTLELQSKAAVKVPLVRSALADVDKYNAHIESLSRQLGAELESDKVSITKHTAEYMKGITITPMMVECAPKEAMNGEAREPTVVPVLTHYGILSSQVANLEREMPTVLLAYYLVSTLVHNGLTVDQLLAMSDKDFASASGKICCGITQGNLFPYEPDQNLDIGFDLSGLEEGRIIAGPVMVPAEDIGLPLAAFNYIDRPPPMAHEMYTKPASRKVNIAAILRELFGRKWALMSNQLGLDDCETSSMAINLTARTIMHGDFSQASLERELGGGKHRLTMNFTPKCFEKMSAVLTRMQGMMRNGSLKISMMVGLASQASAGGVSGRARISKREEIENQTSLGGHCFSTLKYQPKPGSGMSESMPGPPTATPHVAILEGTTLANTMPDDTKDLVFKCKTAEGQAKELDATTYMTLMTHAVSRITQVGSHVVGTPDKMDLPNRGERICSNIRDEMKLPSFSSCKVGNDMPFYKCCMWSGEECTPTGLGTLLVDEDQGMFTGCSPLTLAQSDLRGLSVETDKEMRELSKRICEEVWPPMGTENIVQICNSWPVLPPLGEVNKNLGLSGPFLTSATTESSAHLPEVDDRFYQIKSAIVNETNRLNKGKDGTTLGVFRIGTGSTIVAYVGLGTAKRVDGKRVIESTILASLRQACKNLGMPDIPA